MTEKERLKELIEVFGSYEEMALALGIPKTSIANWMQRGLSTNAWRTIAQACPQVSLNWLATGEGSMMLDGETEVKKVPPQNSMQVVNNYYADLQVSAGQVDYVHADCPPSSLLVPCNVYADAFFPVSGFSMIPTICEGDVIGVKELDCFERIDSNKIYVVITREGERMVKRIIPPADNDGEVTLLSDNPKQGKIKVDRNSIIKVLRVVYIGKAV